MGNEAVDTDATGEAKADAGPAQERPGNPPEAGKRRSRLRRFFLGKAGAALATLLAGVLLGGSAMAWQADAPPFFDDRPCWGALTEADLSDLPLGQERIVAEELPPRGPKPERATCRLTGYEHESVEWTVTIRAHTPGDDTWRRHVTAWPEKFLLSDMVPLGRGLPGMASRAGAWLLLPDGCGWSSGGLGSNPPMLVDVDAGSSRFGYRDKDGTVRKGLARVAVHAANATMDSMGCDAPRYDEPRELAPAPQAHGIRAENLCGVKGLSVPGDLRKSMGLETARHNGSTDSPARVCALGTFLDDARFVTIENSALAELFYPLSLTPEHRTEGYGTGRIGTALSIIWAPCKDGHRAFVLRQDSASTENALAFSRTMFPKYVASEAKRMGCGDVTVTLSDGAR